MSLRWRCNRCSRCFYNPAWNARFAVLKSCPSCDEGHVHRWGGRRRLLTR